MNDIQGKTALLTGGSRGLRPYIGRALAREGVNVALTARSRDSLKSVAAELAGFGVRAMAVAADITDDGSRRDLLEQVKAEFGQIDILVNNAGMEWVSRYTDLSPEFIQTIIQTNQVADSVIRAIKKDIGRIIVNPGPAWPMQILDAIHPGIMSWILRKFGVYDWYRGQSEDNLKQRQAEKTNLT